MMPSRINDTKPRTSRGGAATVEPRARISELQDDGQVPRQHQDPILQREAGPSLPFGFTNHTTWAQMASWMRRKLFLSRILVKFALLF